MATSEGIIHILVVNDGTRNATVTLSSTGNDTYNITDDSDSSKVNKLTKKKLLIIKFSLVKKVFLKISLYIYIPHKGTIF
jgi:hypothetical protein